MKNILYFIFCVILILGNTCGVASDGNNKFSFDSSLFNLGQVRSIVYHQFIGEEDRDSPHPTTNVVYFYSGNLKHSLDLFLKDQDQLKSYIRQKYTGKISNKILDSHMSKIALRALSLYLDSSEAGPNVNFYKMVSARSVKGEGSGIARYEYRNHKLYPVEMSEEDKSAIEKFSADNPEVRIGQLGDTVKPIYYNGFTQSGDLAFEESGGVKWKVKGLAAPEISNYIFDSYLLKNYDDVYFKNHEIYIIEGLDLISLKRPVYKKDNFKYMEAIEITVPEINFYWNWKILGKDFCPNHGHACGFECSKPSN